MVCALFPFQLAEMTVKTDHSHKADFILALLYNMCSLALENMG